MRQSRSIPSAASRGRKNSKVQGNTVITISTKKHYVSLYFYTETHPRCLHVGAFALFTALGNYSRLLEAAMVLITCLRFRLQSNQPYTNPLDIHFFGREPC